MLKSPRKCISLAAGAAFSIWRENSFIHCTLELGGLYTELIRKGFVFFKLIFSQTDSISEDSYYL